MDDTITKQPFWRRPTSLIIVIAVVASVLFVIQMFIRNSNDAVNSNESDTSISQQQELPAGVSQEFVDSLGPFVVRATYNIDLSIDSTGNSAILRNARSVLTQPYIENLTSYSRSAMYVSHTAFDDMRDAGVERMAVSTPISRSADAIDEETTAQRVYDVQINPIYNDGVMGESITIAVEVKFTLHGNTWFVSSLRQL